MLCANYKRQLAGKTVNILNGNKPKW